VDFNILFYIVCGSGLDSTGSEYCPEADSIEHCNEISGPIKSGKFFNKLSNYQFTRMTVLFGVGLFQIAVECMKKMGCTRF
jgi:hypothetical protein